MLNRIHKMISIFILAMPTLLFAGVAGNDYLGNWSLELISQNYDSEAGSTSFVYEMSGSYFTEGVPQSGKDLSHWVLPLPSGVNVSEASVDEIPNPTYEVVTDPTTEVYGLKFDDGQPIETTYTYRFTITGSWNTTAGFFYVKAGSGDQSVEMASSQIPQEVGGVNLSSTEPGGLVNLEACPILADTMGDETYEWVSRGGQAVEYLPSVLANSTPPILAPDGTPVETGAVNFSISNGEIVASEGETPVGSGQLHFQRFFATEAVTLTLTYSGLGFAGYRSTFGVYSYHKSNSQREDMVSGNTISFKPLFIQNVTTKGTAVTFDIEADHYFGFYLVANSNPNTGSYYTENRFNSDIGYVQANDEQRPDGITDHFLFYDTNQGLIVTLEDLALRTNYKLGDQDYEDMIVTFLRCEDGSLIDPVNNSIDTGEPSSGGGAGLESHSGLAQGYAMRTFLKNRGIDHTTKGLGLTQSSGVVTSQTSHLGDVAAYRNAQHLKLANDQIVYPLENYVPKTLGGLEGVVVTPADIPFVSNAQQVISLDYGGGGTRGSVFGTITTGAPYDHAKGVCDRSNGGILQDLKTVTVDGHQTYLAKITRPKSAVSEWAGLLSIDLTSGQVAAMWLPKNFAGNSDATYLNLQVWAGDSKTTLDLLSQILSHVNGLVGLKKEGSPLATPEVFIRHIQQNGHFTTLSVMNKNQNPTKVTVDVTDAHLYRGGELLPATSGEFTVPSGLSNLTIEGKSPLWDGLFFLKPSVGGAFEDGVYLTQGVWSYFDDKHRGGESRGEAISVDCPEIKATSSNKMPLPGCIAYRGNTDINQGVFRTLNIPSMAPWDTLVLDMATSAPTEFCLERASGAPSCLSLQRSRMNSPTVIDLVPLLNENGEKGGEVNGFSITHKTKGHFFVQVDSLTLERRLLKWQMIQLSASERSKSLAELFPIENGEVVVLGYYQGKFHGFANYEAGISKLAERGIDSKGLDMGQGLLIGSFELYGFDRPKIAHEVELKKGWQLYGHAGTPITMSEFKARHKDWQIESIWHFDGGGWEHNESQTPIDTLNPGSAYWILAR